jgi:hypothetical protein
MRDYNYYYYSIKGVKFKLIRDYTWGVQQMKMKGEERDNDHFLLRLVGLVDGGGSFSFNKSNNK